MAFDIRGNVDMYDEVFFHDITSISDGTEGRFYFLYHILMLLNGRKKYALEILKGVSPYGKRKKICPSVSEQLFKLFLCTKCKGIAMKEYMTINTHAHTHATIQKRSKSFVGQAI